MKIITGTMYVIKGFKAQNRKAYSEGKHGDIWREVFAHMDRMHTKPTIHKIKSIHKKISILDLINFNSK